MKPKLSEDLDKEIPTWLKACSISSFGIIKLLNDVAYIREWMTS